MRYFDLPPIIERMLMVSDKISDLNFSVGQTPQVEINGKLTPVQPHGLQKLTPYQTELIAMALLYGNEIIENRDVPPSGSIIPSLGSVSQAPTTVAEGIPASAGRCRVAPALPRPTRAIRIFCSSGYLKVTLVKMIK